MFPVSSILPEAQRILGTGDKKIVLEKITQAMELLAAKGDFDVYRNTVDICVAGRVVTLPSEVDTVLAVNMVGQPALGRDEIYQFHVSGPGTCGAPVRYEWVHGSESPVYRELTCPAILRAYAKIPEDVEAELWVYGYNSAHEFIRTRIPGTEEFRDGWRVPIFYGTGGSAADAPQFAWITGVKKSVTKGPIRLTAVQGNDEIVIGLYQAHETVPKYRRIVLSESVPWVRVHYRRRLPEIRSEHDLVLAPSRLSLLAMLRAVHAYDRGQIAEGEAYEATALRWASEVQERRTAPVAHPVQVVVSDALLEPTDWLE